MRRWIGVLAALMLGAPAQALDLDQARHLLGRTGFGVPTPAEIGPFRPLDDETAVDRLLAGVRARPVTPPPAWVEEAPPTDTERKRMTQDERRDFEKFMRSRWGPLREWWLGEMLATDSPLTERLVLFWHNHFVSELKKVKWAGHMYQQNALFRREAAGNFARLLHEVSKGPAMLIYLDGETNRKGHANENFAREVLELFALGEGQGYGEQDIVEAARAFTGWMIHPGKGTFLFESDRHDDGTKIFLGRKGRFDGDEVLDIILAQPRAAEFIAEKLWREFVSDRPDPGEITRLAAAFRDSGYEIKPLLKGLFMTAAFRDPANRGTLVKSPVDLVVGTMRLLGNLGLTPTQVVGETRRLGQELFDPPNVKGWEGGSAWITTSTLLLRQQLLERFARGLSGRGGAAPAMAGGGFDAAALARLLDPTPAVTRTPASAQAENRRLADLLLEPAYHLK